MNQKKLSIADVLTLLAALAYGFVCYLSLNFYSLGNTKQSILWSLIIILLLIGTALGAKLLKITSRNFKACCIWEMILLVLFSVCMFLFSYTVFPHVFVVSGQKLEIQAKLSSSITQAENMFAKYERYAENREALYKNKLRSAVITKGTNPTEYISLGFLNNGVTDEKQIENKMFTVHADLFPTNYSDSVNKNGIKEVATAWFSKAKNKITGWKYIGIVSVVNEVEQNTDEWLNKLVEFSKVRENGESDDSVNDFDYPLSFSDVKMYFITKGSPTLLSICLSLFAYGLMLMSYLITKRHTKFPGCKVLFGREKKFANSKRKIINH